MFHASSGHLQPTQNRSSRQKIIAGKAWLRSIGFHCGQKHGQEHGHIMSKKEKKSTKGDGRRRSKPKTNNNDYKAREAEFMGSVLTQITIRGKDKDK